MEKTMAVSKTLPAVKAILAATFPEYKGRKVKVCVTERAVSFDTSWDGGSRDDVRAVTLTGRGFAVAAPSSEAGYPWTAEALAFSAGVAPTRSTAIVCHSIFCGKDAGITIYIAPQTSIGDGSQLAPSA